MAQYDSYSKFYDASQGASIEGSISKTGLVPRERRSDCSMFVGGVADQFFNPNLWRLFWHKSPEMVRRELWSTMLAYNLIRTTAAAAALIHSKQPRQISFTSTCQYVLAS